MSEAAIKPDTLFGGYLHDVLCRYQREDARGKAAALLDAIKDTTSRVDGGGAARFLDEHVNPEDILYRVADHVVAVRGVFRTLFRKIEGKAMVVTERRPHGFVQKLFDGQAFPAGMPVYFIDDIRSGDDLKRLIAQVGERNGMDILFGVGGGRVMDMLKYCAMQSGMTAMAFPTSLASHVFASPKIHALSPIKACGHDRTIDGQPVGLSLLDFDILEPVARSHPRLIRAGLGDLLAFHTARHDWQLSIRRGKAPENGFVDESVKFCLETLAAIDATQPLEDWARQYNLIQVLLCEITGWAGSAPASGSEHLFALCAEAGRSPVPLHGELVALGVIMASRLQGRPLDVVDLIDALGLPRSLARIGIDAAGVGAALMRCRDLGRRKERYTVFEECAHSREAMDGLVKGLMEEAFIRP